MPRKHSHYVTKDGRFGPLDWNGDDMDDGTYTLKAEPDRDCQEFPSVTFTYTVRGNAIEFVPQIPRGCSTFRCAWSIHGAAGQGWTRTSR